MKYVKPSYRKSKKFSTKKSSFKKSSIKSKAFTKKVQSIINKDVETKEVSYVYPISDFNSLVNNVADVIRVVPILQQGTSNGLRVGDSVNAKSIVIRGHMQINAVPNTSGVTIPTAIPSNSRFMIRAFVCSVKKYLNYDDVSGTTAWMSKFLKNGATTQALDGTVKSMYLPVNTDVITVHKEIKKFITIPAIYSNTATLAGFSNTVVGFENSTKFFTIRLNCKKTFKYDDTNFSPQNYAPFFCLSYCHLDDSSADIITAKISCSFVSTLTYEDC